MTKGNWSKAVEAPRDWASVTSEEAFELVQTKQITLEEFQDWVGEVCHFNYCLGADNACIEASTNP